MSYTESLTLTIPAALYDTACTISRALDPDLGGAASWGPRSTMDDAGNTVTPTAYSMTTPCTAEFKAQALQLLALPEALHQVVSADYAARWPDLECPTLEDCEAFCAGCEVGLRSASEIAEPGAV